MKVSSSPSSKKIAKELHDGVCQTLTGMHLQFSVLLDKLRKTSPDQASEFQDLEKLIARARAELHTVIKKLAR